MERSSYSHQCTSSKKWHQYIVLKKVKIKIILVYLKLREAKGDDLPADQVSYLGNARPHQVEGEAGHGLYGVPADARLLGRVEHAQRTRVQEGQVAQLALLVACEQVKGSLQRNFKLKGNFFSP